MGLFYTPKNILNENNKASSHFYFYHFAPKNINLNLGLISPKYMYDNNMHDLFIDSTDKYRGRLVNGWGYYKGRDPDDLTDEEIINGINKFRESKNGLSYIYFFKFPPYKSLGKRMKEFIETHDCYRIDLDNPKTKGFIKDIYWNKYMSYSLNKTLDEEYYRNITPEEYFKNYDDSKMNFSALHHIGIMFKNDYCPKEILTKINPKDLINKTIVDEGYNNQISELDIITEAKENRGVDNIKTLNPVVGCNIGCSYCYARKINNRFHIVPNFSNPTFFEERLSKLNGKSPHIYFITSMSDFSGWEDEWKYKVFEVLKKNPQHQYIILTKRPELISFNTDLNNVWIGVTVTRTEDKNRISVMKNNIKCKHYHVTFEPLFEDLGKLDLSNIDYVIIGRETGNRSGRIVPKKEWIMNIVKQAKAKNIPIMMKDSLKDIMGKDFIQEYPKEFNKIISEGSQMGLFYTKKQEEKILRESNDSVSTNPMNTEYDDLDDMYGIPQTRSYPIYDKKSVLQTIKNFNYVDGVYEKVLAYKIIQKMDEYKIDPHIIEDSNKLKKYIVEDLANDEVEDIELNGDLQEYDKKGVTREGGFFFTKEQEDRILNEVEVKDPNGNTIENSKEDELADDAQRDTNDGFGTDPDGGYANRSAGGGGGNAGGGAENPPADTGTEEPAPDAGGEEPAPAEEPAPDTGGTEEPVPDDGGGEEPLPDDAPERGDAGGEEPLPDDQPEGGGDEPLPEDEPAGGDAGGDTADAGAPDTGGGTGGGGEEPLPDDGGDGGEDTGDGEGDTTRDEENPEDTEGLDGNDLDGDIKEIEKQLFSNINPNQMKEKKYQLKKDYMDLYETILRLLDDLNKIPRNSNTQTVLDFLNKKTTELKDLVSYNILHNYDNKTYIENTLTYQECLAALNSIGTILKELGADLESKEDDDEEKDPVDY